MCAVLAESSYTKEERDTAEALIARHYDLLVAIARANRRRARMHDTFCTTDILHEGYLKLGDHPDWASSEHFIRSAALAMRCVIVDHARSKRSLKRGAGAAHVPLDEESLLPEFAESPEQVVMIADLLETLEASRPRWMKVVDARYFSGMTEAETAAMLGLSERTVRREWRDARQWLATRMGVTG